MTGIKDGVTDHEMLCDTVTLPVVAETVNDPDCVVAGAVPVMLPDVALRAMVFSDTPKSIKYN
jgi:hypothetical protein